MSMSTKNPLSGHTDGTNDGLVDGSHILSPSITNLYEGVHGNGILLPHGTAYGDNDRNEPTSLPGAISAGSAADYQIVVKACDVILDGVLYAVGGGSDVSVSLTSTSSHKLGSFTALTSGKECIFIVLATPEGVKVTQTTPITTASGAYASISGTAASYLETGVNNGENRQTIVLGTVRATFNSSAVSANDLALTISERNDKRVFVRPSPMFLSPVRDGNISSTSGINGHTALSQVHGTGQHGTYGDTGVIWQSFNGSGESMLYYSRKDSSNRHTHLLGPTNINVSSPSTNQTFTFDSDQVFVLTASATINLNPSGTFPPGHTVFVSVPSGSTVTFDSAGLNQSITAGDALMFAYDGTNWKRVLFSSTVATTSNGASGRVQLSDGAGGFTSDSGLTFASSTLTVGGKATVSGLVEDPTGVEFTAQSSNPGTTAGDTIWLDSGDSNRLKQGSAAVMRAGDNVSELTNDSGFTTFAASDAVTAVGNAVTGIVKADGAGALSAAVSNTDFQAVPSEGAFANGDKTKLDGIEASADVTDAANVKTALNGMTLTDVGTPASTDRILLQDASDSNNLKYADFSEFGGGGGSGDVVDDTTPQLGGNLDVNGNKITSASNGDVEIEPNGTGDIILDGDVSIDAGHTFRATTLPVVDINSDPNPLVLDTHAGRYLLCSSDVTLPATSTQGDQYYILNDSTSSISIQRNNNNINGAASDVTLSSYKGATCIAIGSNNWIVLGV